MSFTFYFSITSFVLWCLEPRWRLLLILILLFEHPVHHPLLHVHIRRAVAERLRGVWGVGCRV